MRTAGFLVQHRYSGRRSPKLCSNARTPAMRAPMDAPASRLNQVKGALVRALARAL
jgi:hypothetical protein